MTSKLLRSFLAIAVFSMISAFAQTSSAAAPAAAGPATSPAASSPIATGAAGSKIGTINIEQAVIGTNEGQRDMQELQKKFEPKQSQLKNQNDELEALKKQIDTQGPKLNDEALANLKKQIETKQKVFDRAVQDAQEEVGSQQQEIASKILTKMAPMIVKYSQENGYTMIVDTSKVWPQSPVLWWNAEAVDITKAVVDAYNVQSGVAPPAPAGGAAKPAGTKPAGTAKPAASAPPK